MKIVKFFAPVIPFISVCMVGVFALDSIGGPAAIIAGAAVVLTVLLASLFYMMVTNK